MNIDGFKRKKEYLICVDSDGTALDSMTSKHSMCFGPSFVREWGLDEHFDEINEMWCDINLSGTTRGKNRFKTLYIILDRLNGSLIDADLTELKAFADSAPEPSDDELKKRIAATGDVTLTKALAWSEATNARIGELRIEDKKAFDGVKKFLRRAARKADIVIVSGADYNSICEEWAYYGLYKYVSAVASCEAGPKPLCIDRLLSLGYDRRKALMIGDAPTDMLAARDCGIYYYPILQGRETEYWRALTCEYFKKFLNGEYGGKQAALIELTGWEKL
ncbi:MAG: HAD hydrolase-like protein [Roseburia sp.]|nr:HAD hydrolase-like protein [Roseburia sp.]